MQELNITHLLLAVGLCLGSAAAASADPARTVSPAVMHAAPSAKAHIVQNIPANAEIDVSNCSGGWCYVSWRNLFGYVRPDVVAAEPYDGGPPPYGPPPPVFGPWWGWGGPYYGYGWGRRW